MAKKGKIIHGQQGINKNVVRDQNDLKNKTKESRPSIKIPALFLGIVAFFMYANTLQNGYALDDSAAIQKNVLVRKGILAIPEILFTPYHYGNIRARENGPDIDDLYRPASLVMFAVEFQFFGDNPVPGHFVNILLYAGCVILLFLFLYHLFKRQRPVLAFIAALLFAVHPLHTEIVANIKSRDELLCFFFGFLALNTFIKYQDDGNKRHLIFGLIYYFLSLLAKETAITFLAVIPLVFFFYRNENRKQSIYISSFATAPAIIYLVIRFSVLISHHAYNPGHMPFMENALIGAPSFAYRLATAILVLGYYLKLLVIPYPLICDYSYNAIPYTGFGNIWVLLSLAVYLSLIFYSIYRIIKKRNDPLAFGILFFLITISIFSNIFFLLASQMAERFMFFASVGFCVCVAFIFEHFIFHAPGSSISGILNNKLAMVILIPLLAVFGIITICRNNDWKDSLTLFTTDSGKSPGNCRLYYYAASQQMTIANDNQVDRTTRQQMLSEAITNFQRSVSIYPNFGEAQTGLSDAFIVTMQLDSAELHGKKAVALIPNDAGALNALANVYIAKQKYAEAEALLRKASAVNPGNPTYLGNLGTCNMFIKQYDSAAYYFRKASLIDPANIKSFMFLAVAFNAAGKKDSAQKYEAIVKQSEPGFSIDKIPVPK